METTPDLTLSNLALPDLSMQCLIHDLNNVFQTLMEAADLLSDDPQWNSLSAAIFRSIERGRDITLSMQVADHNGQPRSSFTTEQFGRPDSAMLTALGKRFNLRIFRFSSAAERLQSTTLTRPASGPPMVERKPNADSAQTSGRPARTACAPVMA